MRKQAKLAINEMTRVTHKFIPTFGKLTDLVKYQAKSRDKLVNYSCQLVYSYVASLAYFLYTYVINPYFLFKFSLFFIMNVVWNSSHEDSLHHMCDHCIPCLIKYEVFC